MPPNLLIPIIFLLAAVGGLAQDARAVRPARAVDEPVVAAPSAGSMAEKPQKPGNPTKPKPDPAAAMPGVATSENPTAGAGAAMNAAALLPIGVPSFDVRMPEFDEERLISRMRVQELTRIDEENLDLRHMDLERYLPSGGIDYVVMVERGFYELGTGRLVSSSPTRLRGKSIDLHGEGCVYSRDAEVIKILGKVTSYIYVEKSQTKKPKADGVPNGGTPPADGPPKSSPGPKRQIP